MQPGKLVIEPCQPGSPRWERSVSFEPRAGRVSPRQGSPRAQCAQYAFSGVGISKKFARRASPVIPSNKQTIHFTRCLLLPEPFARAARVRLSTWLGEPGAYARCARLPNVVRPCCRAKRSIGSPPRRPPREGWLRSSRAAVRQTCRSETMLTLTKALRAQRA